MEFLSWHYGAGIRFYLDRWFYWIDYISHFFSINQLINSLFAPWKRMFLQKKSVDYFQRVTFNFVSRIVGVMARTFFIFCGALALLVAFPAGGIGLWIWLIFPPLGIPFYQKQGKGAGRLLSSVAFGIRNDPQRMVNIVFRNNAGKFVLEKTGLTMDDLSRSVDFSKVGPMSNPPKTFRDIMDHLIESGVFSEDLFSGNSSLEDLSWAAYWWDMREGLLDHSDGDYFGRPGIALDLLFGYTPILDQHSSDMSSPRAFSHRLVGRRNIVSRMERALKSGKSVALIGQPGVGKTTVALEFARKARIGQLGPEMSYRRVMDLDYNFILSESADVSQKKSSLSNVLKEASSAGNIILVIRDIQKLTNSEVEGYDFTDVFEERLDRGSLSIIAIMANIDYERFVANNMKLRKFFETIEVTPPSRDQAMEILISAADNWERIKSMNIPVSTVRSVLDGSERYMTETPFPEKALELLDAIVMYKDEQGGQDIEPQDVSSVLSEKTGISLARLNESERKQLQNLEEIIHGRLVNQDVAVEYIAKSLRARSVGVTDSKRPIGSFLFLGPTGVGKTETAKVLAKVYYGSTDRIIRFNMSEYAGSEGLERLIGSQSRNMPGVLTNAIKNNPASLMLLDEIEKAPEQVINLFLSLLDEGEMMDSFGRVINGRHLFVIGTSNAAAEHIRELVNSNVKGADLQSEVVNYVLEKGFFKPEFLNRFDGVVVYEPLEISDVVKVTRLLLTELVETLEKKNVLLEISDGVAEKVAEEGYDPAFGARPIRRIIELNIGDMISKQFLSGEISEGEKYRLMVSGEGYGLEKV